VTISTRAAGRIGWRVPGSTKIPETGIREQFLIQSFLS